MAVLNTNNLKLYKQTLGFLNSEVNKWSGYFDLILRQLNNADGTDFANGYPKGKKASDNIRKVLDSMRHVQRQIYDLITAADTFYNNSVKNNND